MQRHVALPGDIANQEGRGVLVRSCRKLHRRSTLLQGRDVGAAHCCRAVMGGLHCLV